MKKDLELEIFILEEGMSNFLKRLKMRIGDYGGWISNIDRFGYFRNVDTR